VSCLRLAVALAVVAVTGTSVASAERIPWDGRANGGAQFVSDGKVVWVLSGTLLGSNVWRIEPGSTVPRRVQVPTMRDIVAGHGQLWGVTQEGAGRPRLYYVDVRDSYSLHEKQLPAGCGRIGHGHVVYGGRLWFYCDFDDVAVFDPKQAAPVRRMRVDGDLIEGGGALWRLDLRFVLRCVAGPCHGRAFAIGTTGSWDTDGNVGWIFRKGAPARLGVLTLVQFRKRALLDGFSIKLPRGFSSVGDVRIVGDEIWVQDTPDFRIARYRVNDPEAPPRLLKLPGVRAKADALAAPAVAAGRVWLSVRDGESFKLFRLAVPRDPVSLRRIRSAVAAKNPRSIYVSCAASKKLFRTARAYACEVRFPKTTSYVCAAVVGGRLAVDVTHNACRR
jgi:hypothetical protein